MVKVKGKYITLLERLMTLYKAAQGKADQGLFERTGKHFEELEPEGWYFMSLFLFSTT